MELQGIPVWMPAGLIGYVLLRNLLFVLSVVEERIPRLARYVIRRVLIAGYRFAAVTYVVFVIQYSTALPQVFGWCATGIHPSASLPPPPISWDGEKTLWLLAGIGLLAAVVALSHLTSAFWERRLLRCGMQGRA